VQAGKRLEFTVMIPADRPEHLELMQIWQQDLRAVGVSLQIRPVALETIFAAPYQAPENWEAVLEGNSLYGLPDGNGNFDTGGTFDGGYSDPHMDSLIHASVNTPDTAALFAYEDYAAQEQPVTILPQGGFPLLVAKRIGGAEKFFNPQGFWAPEELWARDGICGQIPGDTDR
jgi:peptide/nickel transport system substrate-binding protein